jgi:hypothetical protein
MLYEERNVSQALVCDEDNRCRLQWCENDTEAEFLDEIQTKVFRVFLLVIHGHLYSFASRFIFLQTHLLQFL